MYGGKFALGQLGPACSGKEIYHFLLCFTLYSRANSEYKPPGGLIFGAAI